MMEKAIKERAGPGNRRLDREHSPAVVKNARSLAEKVDRKLDMMEQI
jgi:hypothetical protein